MMFPKQIYSNEYINPIDQMNWIFFLSIYAKHLDRGYFYLTTF